MSFFFLCVASIRLRGTVTNLCECLCCMDLDMVIDCGCMSSVCLLNLILGYSDVYPKVRYWDTDTFGTVKYTLNCTILWHKMWFYWIVLEIKWEQKKEISIFHPYQWIVIIFSGHGRIEETMQHCWVWIYINDLLAWYVLILGIFCLWSNFRLIIYCFLITVFHRHLILLYLAFSIFYYGDLTIDLVILCMCFIGLFSWIFARKWPNFLGGPQLGILCGFLSLSAWVVVISPVVVLIGWGCWLILILDRDIIGLAVIMAGTALLLAFYSIMLWWRTQWQSSSMYLWLV